jgi:Mn2+/Fe2+ NRAMP family transporter
MKFRKLITYVGPGIVVAATGIGAGDMVAAAAGGAKYGYGLIWAVIVGALLKFVLNEGLARWQLATGMHLTVAWVKKMPVIFGWYFLVYLILWTFMVSAALMAATGLAAHSLWPVLSVEAWGILHSLVALAFVFWGNYQRFESTMKWIIGLMFVLVFLSVILIAPEASDLSTGLLNPTLEKGSLWNVLAVMGGVGGSVTLLSYGYWINEKSWNSVNYLPRIRIDLAVAYVLTALFGLAIIVLAADLKPEMARGTVMVLNLSKQVELVLGISGKWLFLLGFWAAVFTSMLGVWQGVPYLFADFMQSVRAKSKTDNPLAQSKPYRWYLLGMAILPAILMFLGKPVWLIVAYSAVGALFMPFLAFTLLWLNNSKELKEFKNSWLVNDLLIISLLLFILLAINEWW